MRSVVLEIHPTASFGFVGSHTYDQVSKKLEDYTNTQRFRIYRQFVVTKIGADISKHYEYEDFSRHLLVNRECRMETPIPGFLDFEILKVRFSMGTKSISAR